MACELKPVSSRVGASTSRPIFDGRTVWTKRNSDMPLTTLDPRTALIVVDLQQGLMGYPTIHRLNKVVQQAAALARAFRGHGLPVVLVNAAGAAPGRAEQGSRLRDLPPGFTDFAPELEQAPQDLVVTKHSWGAFTGTGLGATLRDGGVTQVVVCGVATSIGVESTARQAHELGFNVTIALDALTDLNADAHANSLEHIFPRLGERGSTREIIDLLDRTLA